MSFSSLASEFFFFLLSYIHPLILHKFLSKALAVGVFDITVYVNVNGEVMFVNCVV